jgi:hypothetical protein
VSLGFANPLLAWGLLAAALPVLIHLFYRRRPKPTPFPAVDFILRARRETERRLRLKKILLFVARTALLAAAALAIARPRAVTPQAAAAAAKVGPSAVAVVLDASGSMGYRLRGQTLFDRARADALEALGALGGDEPATALVCGGAAAPSAPAPGFDRLAVRRILREAEPAAGHADLTACVNTAARALSDPAAGGTLGKRIVVATDLTASAWRLDAPPPMVQTPGGAVRPEVTLLDAARGAPLPNTAVTDLAVEPDPAVGSRGYRVAVTLAHHGNEPLRDVPLQLHVGAGPNAQTPIRAFADVPANGVVKKTLSYNFAAGGPVAIAVALEHDALPVDDVRWLALDVPREVRALVVDGSPSPVKYRDEAFFVEAALASPASPARPTVVDVESLPKARLADYDVVFLLNVRSLGAKSEELAAFVEKGGGLFISLGDEVDPDVYDAELGNLLPARLHVVKTAAERGAPGASERAARFAEVAWEHPALSIFSGIAREGLEGVRTFRYMLLKPPAKSEGAEPKGERVGAEPKAQRVLVRYDDGAPALVEARRGLGRVILYTSTVDREWSDWTIRTSFLPAMQRIAAYLAGGLSERKYAASVVDSPRTVAAEEGQKLLALVAPDGRERPPPAAPAGAPSGRATFVPDQPGLWQVKVQEGGEAKLDPRLAFSVVPDPRESDTSRIDAAELTAWLGGESHAKVAADGPRGAGERSVPLWSVLLAVALAAFLAEGLLVA